MANFYTDNEDIKFHLGHPLMEKIVALKEQNYTQAEKYEDAPRDYEDAFDNYDKVLEIVGDICGEIVAVNAESVDNEGPQVIDGHVQYAAGTQQNIDVINQAGLNGISLPREWPFRLAGNLFLLGVIFMLASVIITIKTNLIGRKLTDLSTEFYNYSAGLGFKIDDIVITGRDKTAKQDILNALQLSRETNILNLDLRDLQQKVEQLPWVRHAVVKRRFFPNIIQIDIRERQVQSIWQLDHKFRPIDGEGNVIEADYTPDHPILLIVGEGAPENITALMKSITDDQNIFQRIKVANYISSRRWNIVLDDVENGITVKLPEKHIDEAWKKLLKLNTTQGLLKRKLTIIDLRFPNKVIVKLGKMTPEERKKLKDVKERRI